MKYKNGQLGLIVPTLIITTVLVMLLTSYLYLRDNNPLKPVFSRSQSLLPAEVAITKDGFVPSTITITTGQQVTFVNHDSNIHRVIPSSKGSKTILPQIDNEPLQPTDSFSFSFEETGTFVLSDEVNSEKYKATIIVD